MATYDVFSMCNPLYDLVATVSDELVADLGLEKGGMFLVDEARQREIVPVIYSDLVVSAPGGSGANTATGVALLGGSSCYAGRVGDDEHATLYEQGLVNIGVKSSLGRGEGATGISLVLVTPDAQRTMCTFLGCSLELKPKDIRLDLLTQSKYLYVTAYLWDTDGQKESVLFAMQSARREGVKVALSLSDPFCVHRHKTELLNLIHDHVDVIMGNRVEAEELTGTNTPQDAARVLAESADIAVVTADSSGSWVCAKGDLIQIPTYPATPVDTTGAGDMYAAGFLYGLTQGHSLEASGRIASLVAAKIVSQFGPRLDSIEQDAIQQIVAG
jgi:sugar/nucleoside kinase (ribokinase family)